jgi:hypothetical protein
MQVNIACPGEQPRFGISSAFGVEWSQLVPVENLNNKAAFADDRVVINLQSSSGADKIRYEVFFSPFRIIQYVNNLVAMVINDNDSLRYASIDAPHHVYIDGTGIDEIIEGYEIGLGFTM